PVNLSGTAVLDAIKGDYTVAGQTTGLAVGLFSSNVGESPDDTFQAIFDDIEITATGEPPVEPGPVVVAINAGGPALTQNGIDFAADQFFLNGNTFNDNNGGNGPQPIFDGTIFETERFADPLEYSIPVAPGDYTVELYFAEIFQSNPGARIFDVLVEGELVLDDLDILAQTGGDFNQPFIFALPDAVSPGENGAIDISFDASTDNAKVSGIVIRGASDTNQVTVQNTGDASEPATAGQFTVSLETVAATDTVIAYTVGGTATAGQDYAALSGTVTILAGASEATIDVSVIDDLEVETAETVTVTLDAVTAGDADIVLGAADTATVTIADNEVPNEVSLAATTNAAEPDANGLFTVSLSQVAATDTVITYTVNGSATPDSDYAALSGEVTILAGSQSAAINVAVIDDDLTEGLETVTVSLDTVTGDADVVLGAADTATVNIQDDDVPSGEVVVAINAGGPALTQNGIDFAADQFFLNGNTFTDNNGGNGPQPTFDGTVFETERFSPNGLANLTLDYVIPVAAGAYTVELYFAEIFLSDPGARVFDVTVEGQTVLDDLDILAQTGGDFNQPFVFAVPGTISPNTFGDPNAIDISFIDVVDNAKVSGIVVRAAGDVEPLSEISIADVTVNEVAGTAEFTVSRSGPSDTEVTVDFATVDGTAAAGSDYTAASGTVTFAAGITEQTISVNITDDTVVEADETFSVNLSNAAGATIADAQGIGTIVDDDVALLPELSITDVTVNEADGTATFTVSLSEASDSAITVDFATADGTAVAGSDYTGGTGTLTFAAGVTEQTISVAITDNAVVEADETFSVNLSNASGATIVDAQGIGTILNDDIDNGSGVENLLFSLNNAQDLGGLSVTSLDIVQFDGVGFNLFFDGSDVGLSSSDLGVNLEIDAIDAISDTEILLSFNLAFNLPGLGAVDDSDILKFEATSLGDSTEGSFSLYFDGSDVGLTTGGEDIDAITSLPDGSLLLSTTTNLNPGGGVIALDEDIVLFTPTSLGEDTSGTFSLFFDGSDVGLVDGSGDDIDAFAINTAGDFFFSSDVSFAVTEISGSNEDVFAFTPDSTGEMTTGSFATDLFFNGIESGVVGSNDIEAIDFIEVSTDPVSATLSITDVTVNEADGTATFTVSLSEAIDAAVTVDFATADGTATAGSDYTGGTGTLTFAAGVTEQTITIAITDDAVVEADETFSVNLSNASGASIVDAQGIGTIVNDDVAPLPELSINDVTVNEADGTATFTVSLSEAIDAAVTVDFATADGTAVAGSDY
ncbi:MAG: Calx-beta domain-containing protein, partial [Cyanobacteria bacterium P01_C01_bin.147]